MSGCAGCAALHHPKPRMHDSGADYAAFAAPVTDSTAPKGRKVQFEGAVSRTKEVFENKWVSTASSAPGRLGGQQFDSLMFHQPVSVEMPLSGAAARTLVILGDWQPATPPNCRL